MKEFNNTKKEQKRKKILLIVLLFLLLFVISVLLFDTARCKKKVTSSENTENTINTENNESATKPAYEIETGTYVDNSVDKRPETGHIVIPVIPNEITVSTENPNITFANPDPNKGKYYLVIRIYDVDENKLVYESGLSRPGREYKFSVNMLDYFTKGSHQVRFEIQGYSMDDIKALNGNSSQSTLIVK